jgi:uracil-DNA glycosylase
VTAQGNRSKSSRGIAPLHQLQDDIESCRACPRLVAWREQVAVDKRASFRDDTYWGRPVSGFGDPEAQLLVLGLAPAAHGANRTGRVFTGDRSGDWLYRALHKAGFANQPNSTDRNDGLTLSNAWVTVGVRCAPPQNKPSTEERDQCRPFLRREIALLPNLAVVIALGTFAYDLARAEFAAPAPKPTFGHGVEVAIHSTNPGRPKLTLVCSFHPSQQNTFTGKLTEPMIDRVFARARELANQTTEPK